MCASRSLRKGLPTRRRLAAVASLDTGRKRKGSGPLVGVILGRFSPGVVQEAFVHVVIMGCGRVGSSLAKALERLDHQVAVIDKDAQSFRRLGADFHGQHVVGNGFDQKVLIEAGIERAGAFAAVSSGDNSNIISARVARETYGVEAVVARIYDEKRAAVYERLGIPTVATVPWSTDRFLRMLLPEGASTAWRDPSGSVAVLPLDLHEDWVGHSVRDFEDATGCRVAFVMRFGTGVLPDAKTLLQADDVVYVAALSGTVTDVAAAAAQAPEEG
ncbi:potassium channel family protein [Saccharothrix espanaensis]|uniref:potassium channel family protein n=1 Tax=Saccharothrix espanaensis TaxID=103731 RepID=UPI0038B4D1A4